jgi:hypothetical protein
LPRTPEAADEFVSRLRVPELDRRQTEAAVDEMHVRVDEAGNDEMAAQVHDLTSSRARADVSGRPDGHDAGTGNGERLGVGL